ncbi:hypothetical protein IAT38_003690 [Cryptococcus sp. DSM 104549]
MADPDPEEGKWESVPVGIAEKDCATVISSDGVTFRIPKWHLQSSSTVFCHMLGASTPSPPTTGESPAPSDTDNHAIRLDNSVFETAEVLRHYLNNLDGLWAPNPAMDHDVRSHLAAFADKWDCKMVYRQVIRSIREFYTSDDPVVWSMEPFILALQYQEYEVADEAFKTAEYDWGNISGAWGDDVDEKKRCLPGFSVLHPEGWSSDICERVGAYNMARVTFPT